MNTSDVAILIFGIVFIGLMITSVVLISTKAKGDHNSKEYKQAKKKQYIGWIICGIILGIGFIYHIVDRVMTS